MKLLLALTIIASCFLSTEKLHADSKVIFEKYGWSLHEFADDLDGKVEQYLMVDPVQTLWLNAWPRGKNQNPNFLARFEIPSSYFGDLQRIVRQAANEISHDEDEYERVRYAKDLSSFKGRGPLDFRRVQSALMFKIGDRDTVSWCSSGKWEYYDFADKCVYAGSLPSCTAFMVKTGDCEIQDAFRALLDTETVRGILSGPEMKVYLGIFISKPQCNEECRMIGKLNLPAIFTVGAMPVFDNMLRRVQTEK